MISCKVLLTALQWIEVFLIEAQEGNLACKSFWLVLLVDDGDLVRSWQVRTIKTNYKPRTQSTDQMDRQASYIQAKGDSSSNLTHGTIYSGGFRTSELILSSSGPDPVQVHSRCILSHSNLFQFKIR